MYVSGSAGFPFGTIRTNVRNFFLIFLCNCKIKFYFCITKTSLSYGVMVTQQILVLLFLVRIQVAQHRKPAVGRLRVFRLRASSGIFRRHQAPDSPPKFPHPRFFPSVCRPRPTPAADLPSGGRMKKVAGQTATGVTGGTDGTGVRKRPGGTEKAGRDREGRTGQRRPDGTNRRIAKGGGPTEKPAAKDRTGRNKLTGLAGLSELTKAGQAKTEQL